VDRITDLLIARLKQMLAEGELTPGSRLPPERELAALFGISRSSLRHGLKALEAMGVLTQRVGDGTFIATGSRNVLREPLDLLILLDNISAGELLDSRRLVEPEIAARAAGRATVAHLNTMAAALAALEGSRTRAQMTSADLAFHRAIFEAAGDPVCLAIFPLIHRALSVSMGVTVRMADRAHTLAFHRPILEAIERRNPDAARAAMQRHLEDAARLLHSAPSRLHTAARQRAFLPLKAAPHR
jgi:GntR family transcriptional repressor for pyruvate dehydrogenase complex